MKMCVCLWVLGSGRWWIERCDMDKLCRSGVIEEGYESQFSSKKDYD